MLITKGYKTELDPNDKQRTCLAQHAGAARWAYNWGLRKKIESYKEIGKSPTAIDLHRELNLLKKLPIEDGGVPWMYESSKCAPQEGVKVISATISESAGRWYVSLQVEKEHQPHKYPFEHVVGVDVGISHLAVTSDGRYFDNPRALVTLQSTLRVRQKAVSRKRKGSKNRRKAIHRLAVLHARIANVRKDAIHKMTSAIAKSASVIVVESLNVAGMLKNHHLRRRREANGKRHK